MDVALTLPIQNGDKHMKTTYRYVGTDVHNDTPVIAVAERSTDTGGCRSCGTILA
jgi:hypothetical protein